MQHIEAIRRLLKAKANLTRNSPDDELNSFISVSGPCWESHVWSALIDTIEVQNDKILELQGIIMKSLDEAKRV